MPEILTSIVIGSPDCGCHDSPAVQVAALTQPFEQPFPTDAIEYPDRSWFEEPTFLDLDSMLASGDVPKVAVDDQGRVAGYFYFKDSCIFGPGYPQECWVPPPSPTGYAAFHQQRAVCSDGQPIAVGVIGNVHGHASEYAPVDVASAHYADPSCQMMIVRAGDNEYGGWIAGAIIPGLTYGDAALIRRSALSGDWRPMDDRWWERNGVARSAVVASGGYDCIGPTLVNRPGLPLIVARAASAGPVYFGGLGGVESVVPIRDGSTVYPTTEPKEPSMATVTLNLTLPEGVDPAALAAAVEAALKPQTAADVPPPAPGDGAPADPSSVSRDEFDALAGAVMDIDQRLAALEGMAMAAEAEHIAAATADLPEKLAPVA